ncbi:hypothetical protein Tco_1260841 [Tanacetum coccineum]
MISPGTGIAKNERCIILGFYLAYVSKTTRTKRANIPNFPLLPPSVKNRREKTLCTIHPSSSKLLRVKTKGFSKLKVQKSNSRVQEQDGRVNSYSKVLIGGNPQGECHVNMKKAQGMGIFTLESLSEKAQGVTITDCHAGNPCVHICDPTSQSKYPMIGMNKGWRLKGACKSAQTLEAVEGELTMEELPWTLLAYLRISQSL